MSYCGKDDCIDLTLRGRLEVGGGLREGEAGGKWPEVGGGGLALRLSSV